MGFFQSLLKALKAAFAPKPAPTPPAPPQPAPVPVPAPPAPSPAPNPSPIPPVNPAPPPIIDTHWLIGDDFTGYADTAALRKNISKNIPGGTGNPQTSLYTDGWSATQVDLDPTVLYAGHPTMKYTQPSGTSASPCLIAYLPKPVTAFWLKTTVRFSKGFTTSGTANVANSYKLLEWAWSGKDGRGSVEISNTTQYLLYWYIIQNGQTIAGGEVKDAGQVKSEWTDEQWYDVVVQYQQTSSTSAVSRFWMGKSGDALTLRATCPGTGPLAPVDRVAVGLNFNQTRTKSQALWWGQWSVSLDADPYRLL